LAPPPCRTLARTQTRVRPQLPWPNRPLLLHLNNLFLMYLDDHYAAVNGLDMAKVARLLGPELLRAPSPSPLAPRLPTSPRLSLTSAAVPQDAAQQAEGEAVVMCLLQDGDVSRRRRCCCAGLGAVLYARAAVLCLDVRIEGSECTGTCMLSVNPFSTPRTLSRSAPL
jgi:hypothetical protein